MVSGEIDKKPSRNDYIRYALDGLRQTAKREDDERWGDVSRLGLLARFTNAIIWLHQRQEDEEKGKKAPFASSDELASFVRELALLLSGTSLNGRAELRRDKKQPYVAPEQVSEAFERFTQDLFLRLQRNDDVKETAAFASFGMFRYGFFEDNNRLLAHAIADFILMRKGERLPVYRGKPEYHRNKTLLRKDFLEATQDYDRWLAFILKQGTAVEPPRPPAQFAEPDNPWQVQAIHLFDVRSTIFNPAYTLRDASELLESFFVTGRFPQDLAVARPSRMALHETAAALVTRVCMEDPMAEIARFIRKESLFSAVIHPQAQEFDAGFEAMAEQFRHYAAFLIDDHFSVLSPQPDARRLLDDEKKNIERRIKSKDYDPRSAESRKTLRNVLADRLLQRYFANKVRKTVDSAFDNYLKEKPELELPLKANADRIAWVTAGGPASGKSGLKSFIEHERQKYGETMPYCRVNPDDYREILLERLPIPGADVAHSSLTHGEAARITDVVIERLQRLVDLGRGPDMWLDMVTPTGERMKLAQHGGARVRLYAATCPPEVAVQRAYDRGAEKRGQDAGRFVPTPVILSGHKRASEVLPRILGETPCVMRLVDTAPDRNLYGKDAPRSLLTASANGFDRDIEIQEPPGFIRFLQKTGLNTQARAFQELYLSEKELQESTIMALLAYVDGGMTLKFRYPSLPMPEREKAGAAVMLHYAHISRHKVHIDDLGDFIRDMGSEALASAFLSCLAVRDDTQELRIQGGGAKLVVERGKLLYPVGRRDTPEGRVITAINNELEKTHDKYSKRERSETS